VIWIASRLEALVVARARTAGVAQSLGDLLKPLARFAPPELTLAAWRDKLAEVVGELRTREVLDAGYRLRDPDELVKRIGRTTARSWPELADRVLPALGLGVAAEDPKLRARLNGRDAWAAAIVGRALGLWLDGPPPSLAAVCDALAWRELGLAGVPKRCPPEIRALFVHRQLRASGGSAPGSARDTAVHGDAGPPERVVRVLAAREVGAPRPELRVLRDALVRSWFGGRTLGRPPSSSPSERSPGSPSPSAAPAHDAVPASFAADVQGAAAQAQDGWFGDRKVFVSAVWCELRKIPRWSAMTLDELKQRLVAAHRAGELLLARADLVAAMDPELVGASEITTDGASFHFVVKEPAP
jgi:hypothetical protein